MIHFFYGENSTKAREELHVFLDTFFAKNPDVTLFQIDTESFSEEKFDELLASRGLFGGASVIVLDSLFQNKEDNGASEFVLGRLKEMKDSPNIFAILEGKLTKAVSEKITNKAETVKEFVGGKTEKKIEFNRFAIADALGRRNKKETWTLLERALIDGGVPEELHGILFWQVKSMILAASSKSAGEAGLNPFVYKKSLSFAKNFTEEELKKLSSRLVTIYHDARRDGDELPIALEKFVLGI